MLTYIVSFIILCSQNNPCDRFRDYQQGSLQDFRENIKLFEVMFLRRIITPLQLHPNTQLEIHHIHVSYRPLPNLIERGKDPSMRPLTHIFIFYSTQKYTLQD